mgnify:CR=1 FL=1
MCPLQSISVTYTRDRCAYVVDLTLYTVESTAFTRQGSLVQIQPRPPFSTAFRPFLLDYSALNLSCAEMWGKEVFLKLLLVNHQLIECLGDSLTVSICDDSLLTQRHHMAIGSIDH